MDLTNPQSLNRYAYVMNGPMNATDPSGLDLVSIGGWCGFGLDGAGYPEEDCGGFTWHLPVIPIDTGGGGGGGGKTASGTPTQGPGWNTGGKPPLSGETLGIPNSVHIRIPSILQILGLVPLEPACDFGPCSFGFAENGFDPRPLCVTQFAIDTAKNFFSPLPGVNYFGPTPPALSVGAGLAAGYVAVANRVAPLVTPASKALRGGMSIPQWNRMAVAGRVANGLKFSFLLQMDFAMVQALKAEIDSALSGQCRAIGE